MSDPHLQDGELTDATLLARAAAGEAAAFDTFVGRHQASVFRFARTQVARADAAEDLLQQTFLSAWQAAGDFRGDGSARGWLFTITRHAASRWRERDARAAIDDSPVDQLGLEAGWGGPSPELQAMHREMQARVADALAALAPEDREILTLRDLEGVPGDEAAALLGLGVAAMKSRLHRARLRLAVSLREGGCDAPR